MWRRFWSCCAPPNAFRIRMNAYYLICVLFSMQNKRCKKAILEHKIRCKMSERKTSIFFLLYISKRVQTKSYECLVGSREIATKTHQEAYECAHNLSTCQLNISRTLGMSSLSGKCEYNSVSFVFWIGIGRWCWFVVSFLFIFLTLHDFMQC